MSKGPRPPIKNPPIRPQDPDIVVDVIPEQCWTFPLIDVTAAVKQVTNGMHVTGSAHRRKRVLVSAHGEALGFAPDAEASEMIAAAEKSGGALRGSVLSATEDAVVIVELCLRS